MTCTDGRLGAMPKTHAVPAKRTSLKMGNSSRGISGRAETLQTRQGLPFRAV